MLDEIAQLLERSRKVFLGKWSLTFRYGISHIVFLLQNPD